MEMLAQTMEDLQNPISELISDELYGVLTHHSLLSDKGIRDYQIRVKFKRMRERDVPAFDAIEQLRREHPYLQFDTVRKIVYKLNGKR
jgi:hypothetical protein